MGENTYGYEYDPIGNRDQCIIDNGQLIITNSYSANNLNQYTSVSSVPSVVYPTHDADGNMTWDGSWHHIWDAENRLITSFPGTVTNGSVMLEYRYNFKNLRVEKTVKQLSGRDPGYPMNPQADPGTWDAIESRKYIWDGFNIAAEIIIDHLTPATNISYYTWGIDLSGTLQSAGGVGGLLSVTELDSGTNTFYACADGNGNITEYLNDSGLTVAHYEYAAFGEIIKQSGSKNDDFTHRFSTKPLDQETGFIQFQYRPYDPVLSIFFSRDLIEEEDAPGLYLFLENDAVNYYDYLGLNKAGGPGDNKKWHEKVLTYGESHRYGCDEWKNYSGKADRSSYYGHFQDVTLQAHSNVYPAISNINRSYISNELLDLIGIRSGYVWQLDLGKTSLFYTDKTVRADSSCRSGQRYYIEIKVRTNVQYLEKKDNETCCTLKKFDPKDTTVIETSIREQAGDCVK